MRITGNVLDSARRPLVGITVRAALLANRRASNTVTDAGGRFMFDDLEDGRYEISVAPRFGTRETKPVMTWADTGATGIELVLPVMGTITGRVLVDGIPATAVELQVGELAVFGWTKLRATDGRFAFDRIEYDAGAIWIGAPGGRRKRLDVTVSRDAVIDLGEITLVRGDRIRGHVRDAMGAPVAGARVRIGRGIFESLNQLLRVIDYDTTTDETGAYVFDGIDAHLPDVREPCIWATHAHTASAIRALPAGNATIDLVLLETGRIAGVLDGGLRRRSVYARRAEEPEWSRMTTTAVGGAFQFDALPVGSYVVSIPDHGNEMSVTVAAGATTRPRIRAVIRLVELTIEFTGVPNKRPVLERTDAPPSPPTPGRIARGRIARGMNMTAPGHPNYSRLTQDVEPGTYRFSADGGETWTQIVVTATPKQQTVEISASGSTRKV